MTRIMFDVDCLIVANHGRDTGESEGTMEGKPWWQLAGIWLAGAALSGPIGIVLHEFAHFLSALTFDFPSVKMNYASINYAQSDEFWAEMMKGDRAGAAAIHPLHQVGIVSIVGPILTLVLSLGAPYFDEINAARAFGIPVDYFVWPLVFGLVVGWILAIPKLRPHLAIKLPAAIVGPVIGIAAWAVVGPYVWS